MKTFRYIPSTRKACVYLAILIALFASYAILMMSMSDSENSRASLIVQAIYVGFYIFWGHRVLFSRVVINPDDRTLVWQPSQQKMNIDQITVIEQVRSSRGKIRKILIRCGEYNFEEVRLPHYDEFIAALQQINPDITLR